MRSGVRGRGHGAGVAALPVLRRVVARSWTQRTPRKSREKAKKRDQIFEML